jgi:hypothetical protein
MVLSFSPRAARVAAAAEPLSAGHPDGAGGERLAGVVRAALPASGSKGDAEATPGGRNCGKV